MSCTRFPSGWTVCTRGGRPAKRCRLCRAEAEYLCDHCDAPLCGGHAREVSRSKHYCPDHFPAVETGGALCVCMGG